MRLMLCITILVFLCAPLLFAADVEVRDHVYPKALAPAEILLRHGRSHQLSGKSYHALRLYFKALEKLGEIQTDNPYIQKAMKDMEADIQAYIGQIKQFVQEKGLIPYKGKLYTFEGLKKALQAEADRRRRYEEYLRWERQERQMRQEHYRQQQERRRLDQRRLQEDYRFQQEQRRQNEERRRNYDMQMERQRQMERQ